MARPETTEYAPAYANYIAQVPEDDILSAMRSGMASPLAFLAGVTETEAGVCHPPYTWTIKQVVGHLTDCERVFGYRALRFARGDSAPLPGFDENAYAQAGGHDSVNLGGVVARRIDLARGRGIGRGLQPANNASGDR